MGLFDFLRRMTPAASPAPGNPLEGKPLRYLIGSDVEVAGRAGEIFEVGYDTSTHPRLGIGIKYCNLFDEKSSGRFGPYLDDTDTAELYGEGVIDPRGSGWSKNLCAQFARARASGFHYAELDNPDAYSVETVLSAIDLAASFGLQVIAKNPGLVDEDPTPCVAHRSVAGIIVENGAGSPADMHVLRCKAGKPALPVWFVAFGAGRAWAGNVANTAMAFRNMGVTYSSAGEYGNAIDLLLPNRDQR